MPRSFVSTAATHALPPRTMAFCRAAMTVIATILSIGALVLLVGAVVALRTARPSYGQVPPPVAEAPVPAGLFFHVGRDDAAVEAPVLASDVRIAVNGLVARVTVRQHFRNPSAVWLEGVYVFPLPDRSAVDRLSMTVGGQRIDGKIMERQAAREAYDRAAAAGQRASLLSAERPNIFATSVANIGPGEEIVVEIEYQDRIAYEDSRFTLRFPMVVAPRYSPAPAEVPTADRLPNGVRPAAQASEPGRDAFGPVRHPSEGPANPLTLTVAVDAGRPLARLESLYHPVHVASLGAQRKTVSLADGAVPADRDFVLTWQAQATGAPEAAVFAEAVAGDSHLMVMLLPPGGGEAAEAPVPPRDLIFVVDTSGSMHGASMEQAKLAVMHAIDRLRPDDRFNVIRFSNRTDALFRTARPATAAALRRAAVYVKRLAAEGGTEMLPALTLALSEPATKGRLRQVVFVTDGAVDNEAGIFDLIARRLGDTRIFTVGIGSAPNSYLMREAAELGRGSFTYIGKTDEVAERMAGLARKLEQPALTDLRIAWPAAIADGVELYPNPQPDLYAGEPVVIAARLPGQPLAEVSGEITLSGRRGAAAWQRTLTLSGGQAAPGVAALWARAKIAQIEADGVRAGDSDSTRSAALGVALRYALVTPYTSLVAIDERPARPADAPLDSVEIARNLPAGWDYAHVFGDIAAPAKLRALPQGLLRKASAGSAVIDLPQTATPAAQMVLTGLSLLAIGGLLLLLCRGRHGAA